MRASKTTKAILKVCVILGFYSNVIYAQKTIKGKIVDATTKLPLSYASILIKGTSLGATSDENGNFSINLPDTIKPPVTLSASFLGYTTLDTTINDFAQEITIALEEKALITREVVVSGTRTTEKAIETPAPVQKITTKSIENSASGDFYEEMRNAKDVSINQGSMGFKSPNMRGFNTTAPVRVVQIIDGIDNQAPGLNFPVGNLVGISEIDLESVEIITGPSSAMYGPNAFQGVIYMTSKDPFKYPGVDFLMKMGERNLNEAQVRFASTLDKNKKVAFKIVGSYMSADDWIANDDSLNRYGQIETEVDLSSIVAQLQYDPDSATATKFKGINTYFNYFPAGWLGLGKRKIKAPGYMEKDLSDNTVKSGKVALQLSYNPLKDFTLSALYKFGTGSAIYQGSNRYNIKDIKFHQAKFEFQHPNFLFRSYYVAEDAGKSYDIVFTGINISKEAIKKWVEKYIEGYLSKLADPAYTDTFTSSNGIQEWMADSASAYASAYANQFWIKPGTPEFDSLFKKIIASPDFKTGALFVDNSSFWHNEAQFTINLERFKGTVIGGASYRYYHPRSYGTIFSDTLVDPSKKPADGSIDKSLKYRNIDVWEVGGFLQYRQTLFSKLKIIGSIRIDKHKNFKEQFSPFLGVVYTSGENVIRVSAQTAFRSPTLQNQYLLLDIGPMILKGNLEGVKNAYTLNSVKAFLDNYEKTYQVEASYLKKVEYGPVQPEKLTTIEAGYRGSPLKRLFIDLSVYYNIYQDFIGETRIVVPTVPIDTTNPYSLSDAILLGKYQVYQIPINSSQEVETWGAGMLISYYYPFQITKSRIAKLTTSISYTYSFADSLLLKQDDIIPGFNAPKHKIALSILTEEFISKTTLSLSYIWSDKYMWESPFASGLVPSYSSLNGMLSYQFNEYIRLFLGSSNILNKKRKEVYGGPEIGRLIYGGIRVSINQF